MRLKCNICFCTPNGERFFGEGPYQLLKGIDELGSLRASAQRMGMAYTKALALMKRGEREFGFPLTQRTIGGKGGGGSELTTKAKELLMRYEAYKAACDETIKGLYNTHFSTFEAGKPSTQLHV